MHDVVEIGDEVEQRSSCLDRETITSWQTRRMDAELQTATTPLTTERCGERLTFGERCPKSEIRLGTLRGERELDVSCGEICTSRIAFPLGELDEKKSTGLTLGEFFWESC